MFLLHCEHLFHLLDHPMLMNALYMQYHLQHQNTHYHVHCPTPDCTLLVQNKQRALVFHLHHIILPWLRVGNQDLICISIAKWVHYYICWMLLWLVIDNGPVNISCYNACWFCYPIGIMYNILKCEFMCYTVHNVFCYGCVCLLSSAVHFCPDGYTCDNVRKPATLCVCILHSDDCILTVNSFTRNCWNSLRALPSLPLTVPYITLQRSRPVVTGSWMKSPIKRMDMPPNVWSDVYIDRSLLSKRTRNCALNMETLSITTIFNWLPPMT